MPHLERVGSSPSAQRQRRRKAKKSSSASRRAAATAASSAGPSASAQPPPRSSFAGASKADDDVKLKKRMRPRRVSKSKLALLACALVLFVVCGVAAAVLVDLDSAALPAPIASVLAALSAVGGNESPSEIASAAEERERAAEAADDAAAVAAIGTGHPKVQELIGTWQRAGRTRADILLLGRSGVGKSRLVNDIVGMGSELTAEGAWHSQTQRIAPFVVVLNGVRRGDDLARATLEVHVWDTPGLDDEVAYVALLYLHFTFYPLQRYGETFSLLTNPHNSIAPFAYHPPFRYEGTGYKEDRDVVQRHEQTLVGNLRSKIPRVDGSCPLFPRASLPPTDCV